MREQPTIEGEDVQLLEQLRETLGKDGYRLVKGKWRKGVLPDVIVTAFHHFASVALTSKKVCEILEEKGLLPEGFSEKCFWGGAVHDFEKLLSEDDSISKYLQKVAEVSGVPIETLEELAVCAESGHGSKREIRLACYSIMLADYWASQRSLTTYMPVDKRYQIAVQALSNLGIRIVPLFSGLPKAVMAAASDDIVELLLEKGWIPLLSYADGILLVGDETSEEITTEELTDVIFNIMRKYLEGGESQKKSMETSLRSFLKVASRVEELMGLSDSTLEKEVKDTISIVSSKAKGNDREAKKKLIPLLIVALTRERYDLAKEIEEFVLKNKRKLQVNTLIGSPAYFEEVVVKQGLTNSFLNMLESSDNEDLAEKLKKAALLSFATAFYAKNKHHTDLMKELMKLDDSILKAGLGKSYMPLLFAEVFATILKAINENKEEALIEARKKYTTTDNSLRVFAKYMACEYFSSPILKRECNISMKPVGRCYICGAPIFSKNYDFPKYSTYAVGGSNTGVEIYSPRQTPFTSIESGRKYVKERYICPACAFEGAFLSSKLSYPFIAYAQHPSTSYELLKYVTSRIEVVARHDPYELCRHLIYEEPLEEGKPEDVIVDYAHAITLLPMKGLRREEKGFFAHGAVIAKFLAVAGLILERGVGGQVVLTWELPQNVASRPVLVPQEPSWLTAITDKALRDVDSVLPIVLALKAWGLKVCMSKDPNELREMFHSSDTSPHPSLALLTPPRGMRGELDDFYKKYGKSWSLILKEVIEMEKALNEEDRLVPRLWAYAYSLKPALLKTKLSKHKVQGPLRTALYRLVEYLEEGFKEDDAIELATAAAQEDAERSLGSVNVEGAVRSILKFTIKYVRDMNPTKRRRFFEDMLDTVYLLTKKVLTQKESEKKEVENVELE